MSVHNVNSTTKGAASEYRAVADLLTRGLHVFRACSGSCPFDLVAMMPNGTLLKIEVKSGVFDNGRLYYAHPTNDSYDVLCVVTPESVIYMPEIVISATATADCS